MSTGLLYIAVGPAYVAEATAAARTARAAMPGLPIHLVADRHPDEDVFDDIRILDAPAPGFLEKVRQLADLPFERTLFLDTDTRVIAKLDELFDLLDRYDVAAARAPWRRSPIKGRPDAVVNIPGVPAAFSELNTGVLLLGRNAATEDLLARWLAIYQKILALPKGGTFTDQPWFCQAAYESDARFYVLPPEYNCRFVYPTFVADTVKILHGRGEGPRIVENLAASINSVRNPRVFVPRKRKVYT